MERVENVAFEELLVGHSNLHGHPGGAVLAIPTIRVCIFVQAIQLDAIARRPRCLYEYGCDTIIYNETREPVLREYLEERKDCASR